MKPFILIFFLSSCSFPVFKSKKQDIVLFKIENYEAISKQDYVEHLNYLGSAYLKGDEVNIIKISKGSEYYLNSIVRKIIARNELFYDQDIESEIIIINYPMPFHFSLPGRKIILSSTLVNKYLKHEGLLASNIFYEIVRSDKLIYRNEITIPTSYVSTKKILRLLRVPLNSKLQVHKWAFHTLKRAGYDYDHYLGWIQIQNRNNYDFSLQLGELPSIAREEALFKSFLIKNATGQNKDKRKINSSKSFYKFIKEISRNT